MFDTSALPFWATELITVGAIIGGSLAAAFVAVWIISRILAGLASRTETTLDDNLLAAIRRPGFWLILTLGLYFLVEHLKTAFPDFATWAYDYVGGAIWVICAFLVTVMILRLVNVVGLWLTKDVVVTSESEVYSEFMPLVNRVLRVVVIIIALVAVMSHFNIDVKGLLAVLGVGSLAIALAAKDTIANMISGFIIMVDRPFRVGDRIVLDSGEKCDVFHIGLRSTKFKTFENTLIIVPNENLLTSKITNITYPDSRIRVKVKVGVAYGSDVEQVKKIIIGCVKDHPKVLDSPKPVAHLIGLGDNSVDFAVVGRVNVVTDQYTTQNEIRQAIYDKLNEAGIEIPFPQRTVWMKQEAV
jgi:small-conductance mechanosensitive channel